MQGCGLCGHDNHRASSLSCSSLSSALQGPVGEQILQNNVKKDCFFSIEKAGRENERTTM